MEPPASVVPNRFHVQAKPFGRPSTSELLILKSSPKCSACSRLPPKYVHICLESVSTLSQLGVGRNNSTSTSKKHPRECQRYEGYFFFWTISKDTFECAIKPARKKHVGVKGEPGRNAHKASFPSPAEVPSIPAGITVGV